MPEDVGWDYGWWAVLYVLQDMLCAVGYGLRGCAVCSGLRGCAVCCVLCAVG